MKRVWAAPAASTWARPGTRRRGRCRTMRRCSRGSRPRGSARCRTGSRPRAPSAQSRTGSRPGGVPSRSRRARSTSQATPMAGPRGTPHRAATLSPQLPARTSTSASPAAPAERRPWRPPPRVRGARQRRAGAERGAHSRGSLKSTSALRQGPAPWAGLAHGPALRLVANGAPPSARAARLLHPPRAAARSTRSVRICHLCVAHRAAREQRRLKRSLWRSRGAEWAAGAEQYWDEVGQELQLQRDSVDAQITVCLPCPSPTQVHGRHAALVLRASADTTQFLQPTPVGR
jgi:hypothetical protein